MATAAAEGLQAIVVRAQRLPPARISALDCLHVSSSFSAVGSRFAEQAVMQPAQGILASAAPGASEAGRAQALLRWVVDSAAVPSLCTLMREASSVFTKSGTTLRGRMLAIQ